RVDVSLSRQLGVLDHGGALAGLAARRAHLGGIFHAVARAWPATERSARRPPDGPNSQPLSCGRNLRGLASTMAHAWGRLRQPQAMISGRSWSSMRAISSLR